MIADDERDNYAAFLDSVSVSVVKKLAQPPTKAKKQRTNKKGRDVRDDSGGGEVSQPDGGDHDELKEFIEVSVCVRIAERVHDELKRLPQYLSEEIFSDLPSDLRTISYAVIQDDRVMADKFAPPLENSVIGSIVKTLPPSISDSLCSYGLIDDLSDLDRFLDPILTGYVTAATTAPPEFTPAIASTRPPGCEICAREHVPLTYHHLIPRQVHGKAVKRGWHKEWELNKGRYLNIFQRRDGCRP